jgi:ribose 5-phosphate isomerase B
MLYLGADHGGFAMKQHVAKWLKTHKVAFVDCGPASFVSDDDYPDYAAKVAKQVSKNPWHDVGVLICRSGQGMCIAANKFRGVRAALVWNTAEAAASRNDDMTNVLCLPADYILTLEAEHILKTWLETPFSAEQRHVRRVRKVTDLEH